MEVYQFRVETVAVIAIVFRNWLVSFADLALLNWRESDLIILLEVFRHIERVSQDFRLGGLCCKVGLLILLALRAPVLSHGIVNVYKIRPRWLLFFIKHIVICHVVHGHCLVFCNGRRADLFKLLIHFG